MIRNLEYKSKSFLLICLLLAVTFLSSCTRPDPVLTVQKYLRMLSGEIPHTEKLLNQITTQHYRETHHPNVLTSAGEGISLYDDISRKFSSDPILKKFARYVTWTTTYDKIQTGDNSITVVARIIVTERNKGDREKALAIEGLYEPVANALRTGLELPFQFKLLFEDNEWKIDDITVPKSLEHLVEITKQIPK